MAPVGVVPGFDPFEDRVGELVAGFPGAPVEEFDLHRPPKGFHERVVVGGGDLAHGTEQPGLAEPAAEPPAGVLTGFNRSECRIVPTGLRRHRAMSRASMTSSVRRWSAMGQPTQRREYTSITAAQYTQPCPVRCWVMSVTHNR